jgi:hypothetical protein
MDFDKFDNLSKRNVKLILKILSDFEPLRVSSNKKTLYSTRSCGNWAFFGPRGPLKRPFHSRFKLAHSCQKKPNLHTSSLNKLLFPLHRRKENVYSTYHFYSKIQLIINMTMTMTYCFIITLRYTTRFHFRINPFLPNTNSIVLLN